DARRDLDDVGAGHVPLHALAKLPYGALASKRLGITQGVLFLSYATLTAVAERGASRYRQILAWCGGAEFEGLVILDESHRAKNLTSDRGRSSQVGLRVRDLQAALPSARVVYCSATGASEPRNMAYMTRLGLWAEKDKAGSPVSLASLPWSPSARTPPPPFPSFADFLEALSSSRGPAGALALQELVAVDLKAAGAYVCRTLSFAGTEFVLAEAPLEPEAEAAYAAAARFWIKLRLAFADAEAALEQQEGREGDDEAQSRPRSESGSLAEASAIKLPRGGGSAPQSSPMWRAFWGAHQRFFRALCLSAKVSEATRLTRAALAEGKCVVVGLQTTGEASTAETHARAGGQPLDDFASGPREMLLRLLRDAYPLPPDPRARSATEGSSQFVAPLIAAQEGRREGGVRRAAAVPVCYREKNESEHSFLFTSSSEGGQERKKRRRLEGREKALKKPPTPTPSSVTLVESDTTETRTSSSSSSSSDSSS
ncbi:P-loop containing NTP hydrolase pore-1 protein, partial [Helicosporidium sp. ATCC 50920]